MASFTIEECSAIIHFSIADKNTPWVEKPLDHRGTEGTDRQWSVDLTLPSGQSVRYTDLRLPIGSLLAAVRRGGLSLGYALRDRNVILQTSMDQPPTAPHPAEILQAAVRAFGVRDWTQAEALCRQVLAATPNRGDALHMLGLVLSETGRADQAVATLLQATAQQPRNAQLWSNLGRICRETGLLADAVAHQRQALALKEDFPEAWYYLSLAYWDLGQLDDAIGTLLQATKLRHDFPEAHLNLGSLLRGKGRLQGAVAAFETAARLRPDWEDAHFNVGTTLVEMGRPEEALPHFRQVLRLDPTSSAAEHAIGDALASFGRIEEAKAAYARAAARAEHAAMDEPQPNRDTAEILRAAVESFRARDWTESEALCRQALQADLRCVAALNLLGMICMETGRADDAIVQFRQAAAWEPANAGRWMNLGIAYHKAGQLASAVECQRQAISLNDRFPDAYYNLGLTYRALEQFGDAIAAVRTATELRPEYAMAHRQLGDVLREEGRFVEAVAAYQTALQIKPDWCDVHLSIAASWLENGEPARALEHYRRVLQLDPSSTAARCSLSFALRALGRIEEAKAAPAETAAPCLGTVTGVRFGETPAEVVRAVNWVFLDARPQEYDVATPLATPMGGSQSALCYLATALAARSHGVTMMSGITAPRVVDGVRCLPNDRLPPDLLSQDNTVLVVLNGPADHAVQLRQIVPRQTKLVLWTQHAHDQPAMHALLDRACAALWDRIVCVSDWQRRMFHRCLQVPENHLDVLRNAIAPTFERMFRHASDLAEAKSAAARLAYTSTPFRGLDVLVSCFPEIRRRHPECRLHVFSSMQVYGEAGGPDEHQSLYDACRTTEGIDYRGSVSQRQLAEELRGVRVLAYPNTFEETSCIAVMEAMAAGALVVTSDLGALPETCNGWAKLVRRISGEHRREQFEREFVDAVAAALANIESDFPAAMHQRYEQCTAVSHTCTWTVRAAEWEAAAARWLGTHA